MFLSKRAQKEPVRMPMNPFQSPNAIPPRTSSSASNAPSTHTHSYGHGHHHSSSSASGGGGPSSALANSPSRSVLRPVAEGDWLGGQTSSTTAPVPTGRTGSLGGHSHPAQPTSRKASVSSTNFLTTMLQPNGAAPDPARFAHEDLNFHSKKTWSDEKEKVVCGPFDYLFSVPGKDFRTQLITAFDAWLEVPRESLEIITKVVGMLHTASLLVDDVEDSSELRRGLPVAHNIFGVAQTINSANYIYFCALQELQKLRNPKTISIFAEELLNLHRGQGMDLFWRDTITCPTEEDYLEMVGNKTGGLFRLGIKLMQAESRSLIDCVPLVNLVGLIFQIRDDYMNLSSPEYSQNKGLCEDLTEGKFSFLIIHSIRADPTNLQLINILRQKTTDVEVKRFAVAYMERTGTFEYTRKVLAVLIERARNLAEEIDEGRGCSQGIQKIIDKMAL